MANNPLAMPKQVRHNRLTTLNSGFPHPTASGFFTLVLYRTFHSVKEHHTLFMMGLENLIKHPIMGNKFRRLFTVVEAHRPIMAIFTKLNKQGSCYD